MDDDEDETLVFNGMPSMVWPSALFVPLNQTFEKTNVDLKLPARLGRIGAGTGIPNFIGFNSKVVSRSHAEIIESNGNLYIKDLGSAAGTFVNGTRLSNPSTESGTQLLKPNDIIQLGADYTNDAAQLAADQTLKGVRFRIVFRPPTSSFPGGSSSGKGTEVDLNNLTVIVGQAKESYSSSAGSSGSRSFSSSSNSSIEIPQLTSKLDQYRAKAATDIPPGVTKPPPPEAPPKFAKPPLKPPISAPPISPPPTKPPISVPPPVSAPPPKPPVSTPRADSAPAISPPPIPAKPKQREQYVMSITRMRNKLSRVQVQLKNKDYFELNVTNWEQNRKLLIQDHRLQFTKSPYIEVTRGNSDSRYQFTTQMGGGIIATLDRPNPTVGVLLHVDAGVSYQAAGDFLGKYAVRVGSEEIATGRCDVLNQPGGSSSSIHTISVDPDHAAHWVVGLAIVMALCASS